MSDNEIKELRTENDIKDYILRKVFSYSPFEYSREFVKEEGWFTKHKWSEEEQNEFAQWLYDLFYHSDQIRILTATPKNHQHIANGVNFFVHNYAWDLMEKK